MRPARAGWEFYVPNRFPPRLFPAQIHGLQTLPDQVIFLNEAETFKESVGFFGALHAAKRFYVCTKTPVPDRITSILEPISLADDVCASAQ